MQLRDVLWATPVNILSVACETCRVRFAWPSNISLVTCPQCGKRELWHETGVDRDGSGDPWTEEVLDLMIEVGW